MAGVETRPLGPGSSARVKQPQLPACTWRVTEFEDGRSFTWETSSPGAAIRASHRVEGTGPENCRVTLAVEQNGALVELLSPLTRQIGRRFIEMEAQGLKRRGEIIAARVPAGR
jgi:hypothetical protein